MVPKAKDAKTNPFVKDPSSKTVHRRDPEKRREQNRQAQKVYREKRRKQIEELERRAEAAKELNITAQAAADDPHCFSTSIGFPAIPSEIAPESQLINPSQLQSLSSSTSQLEDIIWDDDLLPSTHGQWRSNHNAELQIPETARTHTFFFNCGCPVLHLPMHPSPVLLPVVPDMYINTLHLDKWCLFAAFTEICRQVGITRDTFCNDDAISPFFRPHLELSPAESTAVVTSTQRAFKWLSYDLRPTRAQILTKHHPYLDAIPFRDVRDNLIDQMGQIDQDEFFHDALNHLTCWGGVAGAQTGSPWDGRSWEATEMFLDKWSRIVGGDDGELTRQSRWWRSLRGEPRVTEVF